MKLPILAADAGFFYDAHRASDDCLAAIELLRRPLRRSGRLAFAELLRAARRDTFRVMAVGAPYEARALLKGRDYRWSAGGPGQPKCWYRLVDPDDLEAERAWLREAIYWADAEVPAVRLTAWTRYSTRG